VGERGGRLGQFSSTSPHAESCTLESSTPTHLNTPLRHRNRHPQVRHQEELVGAELQLEQRRQILADILVWAEVTQSRYDSDTAS